MFDSMNIELQTKTQAPPSHPTTKASTTAMPTEGATTTTTTTTTTAMTARKRGHNHDGNPATPTPIHTIHTHPHPSTPIHNNPHTHTSAKGLQDVLIDSESVMSEIIQTPRIVCSGSSMMVGAGPRWSSSTWLLGALCTYGPRPARSALLQAKGVNASVSMGSNFSTLPPFCWSARGRRETNGWSPELDAFFESRDPTVY